MSILLTTLLQSNLPSGISGYSGASGAGTSGFSGFSGSGISGYSGFSGSGISGYSGTTGISGYSGTTGRSGYSGFSGSGISGYSGTTGISGWSGFSGIPGPSTAINATDDNSTASLYPVMVGAAGTNQTPKVDVATTPFVYNASTGTLTVPGYFDFGVTDAISAAGTVQGNATAITTAINNVTTVAAGTGVLLPAASGGLRVIVRNGGANALNVYPNTSDSINGAAINTAYSLPVNGCVEFIAMNDVNWYTLNATYA